MRAAYNKPDFWSQKARQEGYPARSVYKLKEIDEKFALLKPPLHSGLNRREKQERPLVLDLGAAPGSWSLYVLRRFPPDKTPLLAAADLLPLSRRFDKGLFDREDFFFIQDDFTKAPVRETLAGRGPYTLILCDAAPATTGSRAVDTGRSLALAEETLFYADLALKEGGAMAVKLFQGGGTAGFLAEMKKRFSQARTFKPKSCRSDSFETYLVGLGKKALPGLLYEMNGNIFG